ncbi:hypothetical protein LshimejAT787_0113060 [Lyophyllum shimeji]|uniref:Uncharacterized protein n=1 Tax=Lyophyllum shimeji TaxID=47721 RepID=A0A9P3UIM6_LYOSH|nr:hypothetical protein LshimejAT787_0113060 [Lyophyllum shimeji]
MYQNWSIHIDPSIRAVADILWPCHPLIPLNVDPELAQEMVSLLGSESKASKSRITEPEADLAANNSVLLLGQAPQNGQFEKWERKNAKLNADLDNTNVVSFCCDALEAVSTRQELDQRMKDLEAAKQPLAELKASLRSNDDVIQKSKQRGSRREKGTSGCRGAGGKKRKTWRRSSRSRTIARIELSDEGRTASERADAAEQLVGRLTITIQDLNFRTKWLSGQLDHVTGIKKDADPSLTHASSLLHCCYAFT